MVDPQSFASVVLVDRRGWLLLQERDEHPLIDPDKWGFVGGHVDPGEDHESAAYRELHEETGIRLSAGLRLFATYEVFHAARDSTDPVTLWVAPTTLTDDDVECHEGRRIVFVDPERVAALDLTANAAYALPILLASTHYEELCR